MYNTRITYGYKYALCTKRRSYYRNIAVNNRKSVRCAVRFRRFAYYSIAYTNTLTANDGLQLLIVWNDR